MTAKRNAARILIWSIALTGVLADCMLFASGRPPRVPPVTCAQLPANLKKMGDALAPQAAAAAMATHGLESAALKRAMQPGDTVHEFATDVTGGYLVLRGNCYVGEAVNWIR